MAASIPTREPQKLIAGDTLKFTRELVDYLPADGWALSYALVIAGNQVTFTGSDNGDGTHLINVAASTTATWEPGTYSWQSYVTKSGERYHIAAGTIEIKRNFAQQAYGYDARSHVKITLDALEAVIQGRASKEQKSHTIGDRAIEFMDPGDLIKWRNLYKKEYRREQKAEKLRRGIDGGDKFLVRFNNSA